MKKIALFLLLSVGCFGAKAQLTFLNENFNLGCPIGSSATGWSTTAIASATPDGEWKCAPTDGKEGTRGAKCSGFWGSAFHLDTAYLLSPQLNFSSHSGENIYLRFDSKTTKINLGAKLSIIGVSDSQLNNPIDLEANLSPIFNSDDSTDWVTHQVDLTPYTAFSNFYIAFRYTSTDSTGSIWYLDNIFTTSSPLIIAQPDAKTFKFIATGNVATGRFIINFTPKKAVPHDLVIYDIVGRELYRHTLHPANRTETLVTDGLNLTEGIYFVKMWNGESYSTQKVFVH